jgi:hypothetical protein
MASGVPETPGDSPDRRRLGRPRPRDEAALYNAAFVAVSVSVAANDYERKQQHPIPWALAFIVPPLVLASEVRSELPGNTRAYFANWLADHPDLRRDTALRTRAMVPYTRDAIRFGLLHGLLELHDGRLRGLLRPTTTQTRFQGEAAEIVRKAAFVGRWIAPQDPLQVFALLGIRP